MGIQSRLRSHLAANLVIGTPILAIDLAGAKTRLEAIPTVRTAVVERRLPKTVHVVIVERSLSPRRQMVKSEEKMLPHGSVLARRKP